jgi:hypothetical protein
MRRDATQIPLQLGIYESGVLTGSGALVVPAWKHDPLLECSITRPRARDPIYRRRRFEAEIIELCVRWYITYRLSYRDLVTMMAERGINLSHTTILRWVIRYVPEFEKRWNRWSRGMNSSRSVDETYIRVRNK